MSADPVLILQMQRLGDLILSFPLLLDLKHRFPDTPLWIAAEPAFFRPLMAFAPNAVFFPPGHLPQLAREQYSAVINLGTRMDAALCAAGARSPLKLGPVLHNDQLRINGFWQLYRAALTQNNRHNPFHWADLHRLDFGFPLPHINLPAASAAGAGRVGLFLGASEPAKRPDAHFWATLSRRLARAGYKPILLGGPGEEEIGRAVAAQGGPAANFCGKTTLPQLGALIGTLDLLITPDTGPMHLADWLRKPVLNLSMGNVHALETGPVSTGQWIARANMSCVGCWQCSRGRLHCKNAFHAAPVAALAISIIEKSAAPATPGLEILRSARSESGLYFLEPTNGDAPHLSLLLENFWRAAFLFFSDPGKKDALLDSASALAASQPGLAEKMRAGFARMLSTFGKCLKKGLPPPEDFWKRQPLHSRLFAGHAQMAMQNDSFSRDSMLAAIGRAASLEEIFSPFSSTSDISNP